MVLFSLPMGLAWISLEALLWRAGETKTAHGVAKEHLQNPRVLYTRGLLSQQFNVYKLESIRLRRPQTLVLGSSRSLQVRGVCLGTEAAGFYNAGGLVQGLQDIERLADLFDGDLPRPRTVVLVLDPWWFFDSGPLPPSWLLAPHMNDDAMSLGARLGALQRVLGGTAPLTWKPNVKAPGHYVPVGLGARGGDGFRFDGSYRYGTYLAEFARDPVYRDRERPPVYLRIRAGTHQYTPGALGASRITTLLSVLARWRQQGMEVGVLVPPHSSQAVAEAEAHPAVWSWFGAFYQQVPAILERAGYPVVAATSGADLGLSDASFFDGMHPGEVVMAKMLLELSGRMAPSLSEPLRSACSPLVRSPHSPLLLLSDGD